jgi:hypothetical protein
VLISLRDDLYYQNEKGKALETPEKRWGAMKKDLEERIAARPYIFKLVERIKADLKRMEKLQDYEKERGKRCPGFNIAYCFTECSCYNDVK